MSFIKKTNQHVLFTLICAGFLTSNAFATNYYVKNNGNDGAIGTSPETAWETIDKLENQTLLPGDSIFFHAGHTWREWWTIRQSGEPGNNIYFGRYGEGEKPKILGSEKAENWTATGAANIWQTGTSLTNYSEEYYAGRLFFMYEDTIAYGDYKTYDAGFSNLTEEYDYTVNSTVHYVYSTSDPDNAYASVEVNQRERVVNLDYFQSYLEFNGIDILFGRRSNFFSGYPAPAGKSATDLIFRNCYIGYTGAKGSGAAYGIACYHSNLLIENCTFTDNGRRSISINAYASGGNPGRRMENIIIRNNIFKRGYHTTSLDLSTQGVDGDTVIGVYFYNNYIDDSEIKEIGEWGGSNQIFTQAGEGESFMTDIYIVNNVFVQATWRNILLEGNRTHYVWNNTIVGHNPIITSNPWGNVGIGGADTVHYVNNILYDNLPGNNLENYGLHGYNSDTEFPDRDNNLYWQLNPGNDRCFTSTHTTAGNGYYNIGEWNDYLADFPLWDQHSPEPQDPDFVNYNNFDFRLADNSVAKDAGMVLPFVNISDPFGKTDTINKYDFAGMLRSRTTPSIGAYEYRDDYTSSVLMNSIESVSLKVFPNPATDFCKISITDSSPAAYTVQLYNLLGNRVYTSKKIKTGEHIIPTGNLTSGIYIIYLIFDDAHTLSANLVID